jgi:phosphohistidine phosphatase SixA
MSIGIRKNREVGAIMRWFCALFFLSAVAGFVGDVAAQTMSQTQLFDALRGGGHILLLRHAQTEPGIGDPPGFKLSECATQRNLSAEGRAHAKRTGDALAANGVRFTKTLASQWCRCRDTAKLISENVVDAVALNSFFNQRSTEPKQTATVRAQVKSIKANESWLMVTHQVNINALTGISPAMGEGVVVRVKGGDWKVIGNLVL